MTEGESALRQLAELAGIVPEYVDQTGNERRRTTDATRVALLAVMGVDASTDRRAADALAAWRERAAQTWLAPVRVTRRGQHPLIPLGDFPPRFQEGQSRLKSGAFSAPEFQEGQPPAVSHLKSRAGRLGRAKSTGVSAALLSGGAWRIDVTTEAGQAHAAEGKWRSEAPRSLKLPFELPLGYHHLTVTLSAGGREVSAAQRLIVVPDRCVLPAELLDNGKCFGVIANLYTLRSGKNWGVGDLSDLAALAEWTGGAGADFVGVNPLHALLNRGGDISPYSPMSRLFRNPLYIDVCAVPELAAATDVQRTIESAEFQARLAELRETASVSYEQVSAVKQLALDALYRAFSERERGSDSNRTGEFDAFARSGGAALERFAIWNAIMEQQRSRLGAASADWRQWPPELREAGSSAVARFAAAHADRVRFHQWLQFETDRQLGAAAARAREAGMRIGIYQDLAIGSSPSGADTWANPDLFLRGASIGAPPDPYSAQGQNWGLPPVDPRAMRESGYEYFINLVRSGFRHAGALRIDHAMGLFRLFWIPDGGTGSDGAYVSYPAQDCLGIIALESLRHGALVVGEDLGTVPKEVPPALEKWGVLSSKVLYFERDRRGGFKRGDTYKPLALATANTHDMPTVAAFWQGRDIELRRAAGLIPSDDAQAAALGERERDRAALLRRLRASGSLSRLDPADRGSTLRGAVHDFLCKTPSQLVGLSLDDLAGEIEPVNLPGIGPEGFSSWTRKMTRSIEEMGAEPGVAEAMRCPGRDR